MLTEEEKERLKTIKTLCDNQQYIPKGDSDFLQYCYDKEPEYYRSLITSN